MIVIDEDLIATLEALYSDLFVAIVTARGIPHDIALSIVTDIFQTMRDY